MTYVKTKVDSDLYRVLEVAACKHVPESSVRAYMKWEGASEEEARTDLAMSHTEAATIDNLLEVIPLDDLQKVVQKRWQERPYKEQVPGTMNGEWVGGF